MKKLLVCVLVAVLLPASLFAIDLSAGVKGGINLGMFSGSDWKNILELADATNGMKLGLSATAFLNIAVTESIIIQPEVGYTALDAKTSIDSSDLVERFTVKTIEFPVFIMPRFSLESGSLTVFAGPDFFYVLGDMTDKATISGISLGEAEIPIDNSFLIEMFDDVEWNTGAINVRVGYSVQL